MRVPHFLIRLFAIPSLVAGIAVCYDLFLATPERDLATVTQKTHTTGRWSSYDIYARGHFSYYEGVSRPFYELCESGDTLQLSLTPVFKEWRRVSLVRGGSVLGETMGTDLFYMELFGFAFLIVAAASFFVPATVLLKPLFWISVCAVDLVAVLLCFKYVAVLAGVYEKM